MSDRGCARVSRLALVVWLGAAGVLAPGGLTLADTAVDGRAHKLQALMEASGVSALLRDWREAAIPRIHEQAETILNTNLKHMRPDAAMRQRLLDAEAGFEQAARARLDRLLVDNPWLRAYDRSFSDAELDRLLEFYASPLHARERALALSSQDILRASVEQTLTDSSAQAIQDFVHELRQLSRECHCRDPGPTAAGPGVSAGPDVSASDSANAGAAGATAAAVPAPPAGHTPALPH